MRFLPLVLANLRRHKLRTILTIASVALALFLFAMLRSVATTVDDQFRNSTAPTKTGTEKAFAAGFASMWGNVKLLMSTIGLAVVFAILLVTANAMMMNQRERTSEVAVMKTVGFTDGRVGWLVIVEAAII